MSEGHTLSQDNTPDGSTPLGFSTMQTVAGDALLRNNADFGLTGGLQPR